MHAVAALILGRVARGVRRGQHLRDAPEALIDRHDADARADEEGRRAPDELELLDDLEERACDLDRILLGAVVQQDAELVAPEARERVAGANLARERRRQLPQELIARDVAAGVVDELELIEIEVEHRVARIGCLRRLERTLQLQLEFAPVDEAGERVVARFVGELARQLVRFRDVRERAFVIEHATLLVAHGARILEHHDLVAVLALEHELGVADLALHLHVSAPVVAVLRIHVEIARDVYPKQLVLARIAEQTHQRGIRRT